MQTGVLFVCMGNICRSPTAEAVFRHYVADSGLGHVIAIDSAGTHDYHPGKPPDIRSQNAAAKRGYSMKDLRARQVQTRDFQVFDYILAMDRHNLALLQDQCPSQFTYKLGLLMQYSKRFALTEEVPDPYFGGAQGFETVLDMVEEATTGLLEHICSKEGARLEIS